jgi:hypothetical protein
MTEKESGSVESVGFDRVSQGSNRFQYELHFSANNTSF